MPCVSRAPHIRLVVSTLIGLIQDYLYVLYSDTGPLKWGGIFALQSTGFGLAAHFLMASTFKRHARLRILATTLLRSTRPPSESLLDASFVVYIMWSPWRPYFYVGKTVNFRERLRKHIDAFLNASCDSQQPYMEVLRRHARGDAARAASAWFYLPIGCLPSDAQAFTLEQHVIDSEHPRLNVPYVHRFALPGIGPHPERHAVWHRVHKRHEGTTRAIGLKALESVRRFRRWPPPRLHVQGALQWLPRSGTKRAFQGIIHRLIQHARERGQTLLLPAIRDLKVMLAPVAVIALRAGLRNAPSFYRRFGDSGPWPCARHLHPDPPRYPSPDGECHIFAPQDTWPWPAHLSHLRTLPAHAALVPSQARYTAACRRLLWRLVAALRLDCSAAFTDCCVHDVVSSIAFDFDAPHLPLDFHPVPESVIRAGRSPTRGLVVEEFQNTKHVLVAECPRRVQLLCAALFGITGQSPHFVYHPGLTAEAVLQQVASVPGLGADLQPARLSNPRHWRMASASAPNKKREKPDSRRPLVDRSRWPTQGLESPAARAIDWISGAGIPEHLHIDAQRTDSLLPLLERFSELAPRGPVQKYGTDLTDCFTNIPHCLERRAWAFYQEVLAARDISAIAAPRRRGSARTLPLEPPRASPLHVVFRPADLTAAIEHSLANLWLAVGTLVGRATDGLAMGSSLAGALTRMVLIYCDVVFHASLYSGRGLPPPARSRVRYYVVEGVRILILESRYMDDYICLWKASVDTPPASLRRVADHIASWPSLRYPLPSETDGGDAITGMRLSLDSCGRVSVRPASLDLGSYSDDFQYPPYMHFRSFVPNATKRAIVLGLIARTDAFTYPLDAKAAALAELLTLLITAAEFPEAVVKRWATQSQ
ncbi:unnamed protein product, partial [Prorocentrum cordatum]